MVICAIPCGGVGDVEIPQCDVALFGFEGLGKVDYESEICGKSEKFERAVRLSNRANCAVICGCFTRSRGIVRKSVAVCSCGKLLGITDMNHVLDGESFKGGAYVGFYNLGGCKVGVCIENDLLFPETFNSLSLCGCNLIVTLCEGVQDGTRPLLIRAYSYIYGIPIVMCAGNIAYFSDVSGDVAWSNQNLSLFEITHKTRYRLVTTRTKGMYFSERGDY
jgi:predicted amidohydrolase